MIRFIASLVFSFVFVFSANAVDDGIPAPPTPMRLVNDLADILKPEEEQALERDLVAFNDSTSNQILVLTVTDLNGFDPADYAQRVGQKWGVGQKKFNNGVVILIKPTGGQGQRHVYIAVGYGLEGAIPDATAKLIVNHELLPAFKKQNFAGGIANAVAVIKGLAKKEYSYKDYNKKAEKSKYGGLIVLGVILLVFILMNLSKKKHYTAGSTNSSLPFWATMFMMSSMGNNNSSSGWDSFSSGSGSFGGFGGGGFGGGGAGGSW